eukprot:784508-Prorocentrum_lima.AAC.3
MMRSKIAYNTEPSAGGGGGGRFCAGTRAGAGSGGEMYVLSISASVLNAGPSLRIAAGIT